MFRQFINFITFLRTNAGDLVELIQLMRALETDANVQTLIAELEAMQAEADANP